MTLPVRQAEDPVWLSAALDPALERSLLLLDTSDLDWRHSADKHGAVSNAAEATLVAHIAAQMVQVGPGAVGGSCESSRWRSSCDTLGWYMIVSCWI